MSTDVKILGCAWSPRSGNTEVMVQEALDAAGQLPGVTTEFYSVAGKKVNPCKSTYACERKPDWDRFCHCYRPSDDEFHEIAQKVMEADGIIFGCPVFWMSVTGELKCFMDRAMSVEMLGFPWRNKVAGFLTVAWDRNGGQEHTIQTMLNWAMMHDLFVVGAGPERPAKSIGGYTGAMGIQGFPFPEDDLGGVRKDEVGMYASRLIGWRVAEATKVIKAGFAAMTPEDTKWGKGAIDFAATAEQQPAGVR